MDQLQRADVETFKNQEKTAITLVLDNVRSMHNVGSAFRTADGFAIEKYSYVGSQLHLHIVKLKKQL